MALPQGTLAPNFQFIDRDGVQKSFHDVKGEKVVFFFPAAFTAGCTAQACSLRDRYEDLKSEGISEVFAISIDSEEKITSFKEKYGLDYITIADVNGEISKKYGVYNNFLLKKMSGRVTYTVNQDNIIRNVLDSGITGRKSDQGLRNHAEEIIDVLKL